MITRFRTNPEAASEGYIAMFDDLLDLGKKRTLKQSVGFFLFYAGIFLGITAIADIVGL